MITVYGASDDLIEVEGDLSEEFNGWGDDDKPHYLGFSDGTLLSVTCTKEGAWRINRLSEGSATYIKTEATDPGGKDYSDRVTLDGEIRWVVCGKEMDRKKRDAR